MAWKMDTKRCSKCNVLYPATKEYFHLNALNCKYGLHSRCKECTSTFLKDSYLEDEDGSYWMQWSYTHHELVDATYSKLVGIVNKYEEALDISVKPKHKHAKRLCL